MDGQPGDRNVAERGRRTTTLSTMETVCIDCTLRAVNKFLDLIHESRAATETFGGPTPDAVRGPVYKPCTNYRGHSCLPLVERSYNKVVTPTADTPVST